MNELDDIWDELNVIYSKWGIEEIPFSESASTLKESRRKKVFTGRRKELKEVLNLFRAIERKRILIYGWIGMGKTAFILVILDFLNRKMEKTLTAYISLPADTDLATAALIALARQMKNDEWAQNLLNQMGLITEKPLKQRESKAKAGLPGLGGEISEKTIEINEPRFPELSFEDLLKRALKEYDRVVIAIDDLDKQDPARVKQLLLDAQGMLKSGAWFILTGHPFGLTRDLVISERGLFDFSIKLEPIDQATMYKMLVKYLNSVRPQTSQYSVENPQAVKPFTKETARMLCQRSSGVPRWLNRLGNYVLQKASEINAEIITTEILQQGFIFTNQQVRGQLGLTPEDFILLNLVLEKGQLSDENITLEELQKLKVQEFSEVIHIIDKLVQADLIRRLPNDTAIEVAPTPLIFSYQEIESESSN